MPELPEVETVVRDLIDAGTIGATIEKTTVNWPRTIQGMSPQAFDAALRGRRIVNIWRRAKFIVFAFDDGGHLLMHLRMTGKLRYAAVDEELSKHDHVVLHMTDQRRLVFNDTRKFGRLQVVGPTLTELDHLGPEPLAAEFTQNVLKLSLGKSARKIKPLLLDQSVVAGLGNIYVDEALWACGIHPERPGNSLTTPEVQKLHRAIRSVLKRGIKNQGTTLGNSAANFYSVAGHRGRNSDALKVFRRDGLPCPRCQAIIQRSIVGQRGTHFCAQCQPRR